MVWRWKDGDNYYVARANALENNVSLYYTENGRRNTSSTSTRRCRPNTWHTLRVEFAGARSRSRSTARPTSSMQDAHINGGGAVGVWTKADSVTAFDDFRFGSVEPA